MLNKNIKTLFKNIVYNCPIVGIKDRSIIYKVGNDTVSIFMFKKTEGDEEEIKLVVGAAGGHTVKVILETCYLSEDEKVACTLAAARAKANFVKTSTGFGTGGALVTDVVTMKANITPDMEVKASGGIKTLEDALTMVKVGATRIGTSSGVQIVEAYNEQGGE